MSREEDHHQNEGKKKTNHFFSSVMMNLEKQSLINPPFHCSIILTVIVENTLEIFDVYHNWCSLDALIFCFLESWNSKIICEENKGYFLYEVLHNFQDFLETLLQFANLGRINTL